MEDLTCGAFNTALQRCVSKTSCFESVPSQRPRTKQLGWQVWGVLKHAEKRRRSKEDRIETDERRRRKLEAESVSPESISDTNL